MIVQPQFGHQSFDLNIKSASILSTEETKNLINEILLDDQLIIVYEVGHQHPASLHRWQLPVSKMDWLRCAWDGQNGLCLCGRRNRGLCSVKPVHVYVTHYIAVEVFRVSIEVQSAHTTVHEEVEISIWRVT